MKIIALDTQTHLDALLSDLHASGVREDEISLIRRGEAPEVMNTLTVPDGPLQGVVSRHHVAEEAKHGGEMGLPTGAAIGAGLAAAAGLGLTIAAGPIGWVALLGLTAAGGGIGAVSGLGIGAVGGALATTHETTHHKEQLVVDQPGQGDVVIEGQLTEPSLSHEQQTRGREIVDGGGVLVHLDHHAFPDLNMDQMAQRHGGSLL